ncbi:MAG: hypothetical protein WBA22_03620 [Candidatus Methanofastidiosia archaeon]
MKNKTNQWTVFLLCFVILFLSFYCGITAWRNHSLNVLIEEHSGPSEKERNQEVIEFKEKLREDFQSAELEPSYAPIFSDPLMIDYMATELSRIAQTYQAYYFDILPKIIEKPRVNLLTGFFHVYGTYYSYMNLKLALSIGVLSSAVQLGDSYCKSCWFTRIAAAISAWEAEGNSLEGEWLDRFIQSPRYDVFLTEALSEIEHPEGEESITSMGEEILNLPIEESLNPVEHLKNYFLYDARELTEIVLQSYEQHKLRGDFVLASVDAKIIEMLHRRVVDTQTLRPLHYYKINSKQIFPNPYVDLGGVFILSLISSSVIIYICKKIGTMNEENPRLRS